MDCYHILTSNLLHVCHYFECIPDQEPSAVSCWLQFTLANSLDSIIRCANIIRKAQAFLDLPSATGKDTCMNWINVSPMHDFKNDFFAKSISTLVSLEYVTLVDFHLGHSTLQTYQSFRSALSEFHAQFRKYLADFEKSILKQGRLTATFSTTTIRSSYYTQEYPCIHKVIRRNVRCTLYFSADLWSRSKNLLGLQRRLWQSARC